MLSFHQLPIGQPQVQFGSVAHAPAGYSASLSQGHHAPELEGQWVAQAEPECHEAWQPLNNLTDCPHRGKPQGEGRWAWETTLMLLHRSATFGEENGFDNRQL